MAKTSHLAERLINEVCQRLRDGKQVRRTLPEGGRLRIDRPLPFLCIYRRPRDREDAGTERLIMGEAAYLKATSHRAVQAGLARLVRGIADTTVQAFGSILLVEVWSAAAAPDSDPADPESTCLLPRFRVFAPKTRSLSWTLEVLERSLRQITIRRKHPKVETITGDRFWPAGVGPLITPSEARKLGVHLIGLEVKPVYRDARTGQLFPLRLRSFRHELARSLKKTFYEFAHAQTTYSPPHFQALGQRAITKYVWQVDAQLATVASTFDLLLSLTPINVSQSWAEFHRRQFTRAPEFIYRPRPMDPGLLKRQLYAIPIEYIEDPLLAQLFREKQEELDRQITMIADRGRAQVLYGSLQTFGGVDSETLSLATDLLYRIPSRGRENSSAGSLNAQAFAEMAAKEIEGYRQTYPELNGGVEVRSDVIGLMVSQGNLLVGAQTKVPCSRAEALIQHEIGTHLLTYVNGRAQPFKQLYTGLAGYEELQEGLAVLAEYLVGGLSRPRLRLLAARVLAVRRLIDGASFVETYRELDRAWDFEHRTAFTITMRVYRGGGLTKDAIYLKGLVKLLDYVKGGGELDPLFVGKMGLSNLPVIQELLWRKVLRPAPLRPRYLDNPAALQRLKELRHNDGSILDLVGKKNRNKKELHENRILRKRHQDRRGRLLDDSPGDERH